MHYLGITMLLLAGISLGRTKEAEAPEEGYLCDESMLTAKILMISKDKDWDEKAQ